MSKLLNKSLRRFTAYAGIVLACSIPVYYFAISALWQYELDEHNIILTAEAGREDSFLIIGAIMLLTVLFFGLLLGGFVWLNRRISSRLWQPFYVTLEKIRAFDLSSHTVVEFGHSTISEFEELNQSIAKLVNGNVEVFRQQKEFTENASHELQTPLAVVQSKLDLLLQDPELTAWQSQVIEETNAALSRVTRINKNLLLLAKIENQQFADQQEVNIDQKLEEMIGLLSGLFGDREISYDRRAEVTVHGNSILIEIMLSNLLMNALRYAPLGEAISILLSDQELVVANAGNAPLNGDKLFRRFSTANEHAPGSGLGLSIVKEICSKYGWGLSYRYAGQGHEFVVRFTVSNTEVL